MPTSSSSFAASERPLRSVAIAARRRRCRRARSSSTWSTTLVSALYPRHFGPADLAAKDVDAFVTRTLDSALHALHRQVELELALAKEWRGDNRIDTPLRAGDLVTEFAAALPRVRALLDKDVRAAFEGDPSARSIDEIVFCFPGFAAIIRHRLAHQLHKVGVTMIARIIAEHAHSETEIDIHPGAEIGEGFFIDHGTGVVIGETAVIGRSVRLYQMVTLGAKRFEADASGVLAKNYPRHPIVEDDVVIYAGATVLGRVTIGKGSSIGGNVWLTRDVPPGSNITQAKARNESFDDGGGI